MKSFRKLFLLRKSKNTGKSKKQIISTKQNKLKKEIKPIKKKIKMVKKELPKRIFTRHRFLGDLGDQHPKNLLSRNNIQPLECLFGPLTDCDLSLNIVGGNSVDTSANPFMLSFKPSYIFPDGSNNYVDSSGYYRERGMPHFYLIDVFNDSYINIRQIIVKNEIDGNNKPIKSENGGTKYKVDLQKDVNLFLRTKGDLKGGADVNSHTIPISVIITPYDINLYAGYPIVFMFDQMGRKLKANQVSPGGDGEVAGENYPDWMTIYYNPSLFSNIDIKMGNYITQYFDYPIVDSSGSIAGNNITYIYGLCNNNILGITMKIEIVSKNKVNADVNSLFVFQIYPFSNSLFDYPESLQPISGQRINLFTINKAAIVLNRSVNENGDLINPTYISGRNNYKKLNLTSMNRLNKKKIYLILLPKNTDGQYIKV